MKFVHVALGIFLLTLSVVVAAIGYRSWGAIGAVQADAVAANAVLTKLDTTLDRINAPCTGFHGSVTCGTLAQINQSVKNIGAMAAQSQQQVRQSAAVIVTIQETLAGMQTSFTSELTALEGTTNELTTLLTVFNDPNTGVKPLLVASTKMVNDTDKAVNDASPEVTRAVKATADIGEQGVIVTTNAAKVTTHYEQLIDNPPHLTFWQKVRVGGEMAWKVLMLLK